MKKFEKAKWFVLGMSLTLVLTFAFPALAETIDAAFNSINITQNGQTVASVGQSYSLSDGTQVPYSINYRGTTYLPLRKIGELCGKDIGWDAATGTASINDPGYIPPTPTGTVMYDKYPTVPDFGAFYGVPLADYYENSGDTMYFYSVYEFTGDINGYCNCLVENGFYYLGDATDSNGNPMLMFAKDNISVVLGLMPPSYITVTVMGA